MSIKLELVVSEEQALRFARALEQNFGGGKVTDPILAVQTVAQAMLDDGAYFAENVFSQIDWFGDIGITAPEEFYKAEE
jgi:hypothetical protein